jgi:hypothetical protein
VMRTFWGGDCHGLEDSATEGTCRYEMPTLCAGIGCSPLKTTSKQRGGVTGRGFLPGRSGNPGGRPKRLAKLIETIQRQTRDGQDLVDFMLQTFRSGPMRYRMEAAHWLTERGFGKPPQTVELTAEDGGPVVVKLIWPESD